jgi:hypothetical protein
MRPDEPIAPDPFDDDRMLRVLRAYVDGNASVEAAVAAMGSDDEIASGWSLLYSSEELTSGQVDRAHALERAIDARAAALRVHDRRLVVAQPIEQWHLPEDATHFCCTVVLEASGHDGRGAHMARFRMSVCTPSWLAAHVQAAGWLFSPAPLVLARWEPAWIHEAAQRLVTMGGDHTWRQFCQRLNRVLDPEP